MAGRGRGRGRGDARSFNKDQLNALGVGNEPVQTQVIEPPPLYRMLERKPVPLEPTKDLDYLLLLKQDFIHRMQLSPSYLKLPQAKSNEFKQEIDKLVAQLPVKKEKYHWNLFPSELRPKLFARRIKDEVKREEDITQKLMKLEEMEKKKVKLEVESREEKGDGDNEEEVLEEEDQDEEMDEETDYLNNYFDPGEGYEDEDDNMDDGAIY